MTDNRIDCRVVDKIEKGTRYVHSNVRETDEDYDGCCVEYTCSDCGTSWWTELPE